MQNTATFWDKIADKYARDAIADMDSYTYTLERTRSYLSKTDNVLEVGCGTGSTALELAPNVASILGTDLAPNMIRIATEKLSDGKTPNVSFAVGDIFDSTNERGPFDAVLAHNVLHLVEEVPAALNRINGLLKPGGVFVSKTFCLDPATSSMKIRLMKRILPLMQMIGKAPFVSFMSINDFEGMITQAGFKIIETGNHPATEPRRYIVARKI